MATVREYRTCDICGQKLNKGIEEFNYRIEPKHPLKMAVWRYILGDPYDGFWGAGIDMCSDCWEQMKTWIKMNKKTTNVTLNG